MVLKWDVNVSMHYLLQRSTGQTQGPIVSASSNSLTGLDGLVFIGIKACCVHIIEI